MSALVVRATLAVSLFLMGATVPSIAPGDWFLVAVTGAAAGVAAWLLTKPDYTCWDYAHPAAEER